MANYNDVAISVKNLSKTFRLPHEKQSSLKGAFLSFFRPKGYELQQALDDVSFEVKKGEFFGIVGRNGSGKSTLLKTMAGIYAPDSGGIKINGKLVPFIELGVGFNPELTGRENVYLNGALLGLSRKRMDKLYDEIVEFAELKKFMDQKLNNYSSGMQVRLAFSIAIRAEGDVLLLDEVLAVGDAAFQQKCFDYFATLKRDKRTIILVSHSMANIELYCDRALLLEAGSIQKIGSSSEIANMYEDMFLKEEADKRAEQLGERAGNTSKEVEVLDVELYQDDKEAKLIEVNKDFQIVLKIKSNKNISKANVGINIRNGQNLLLFNTETRLANGGLKLKKGEMRKITITLENIFTNGTYQIGIGVADLSNVAGAPLYKKRVAKEFVVYGAHDRMQSIVLSRSKIELN